VHLGASLIWLVYGGLRPDGRPTDHLIAEYDARIFADKHNRALMSRIRAGVVGPQGAREPARPIDLEPRSLPRARRAAVRVIPIIGPGNIGVMGTF